MITEKRYFVTLPPETLTPQQEGMVMLVNDLLGQDNSKAMRRLVMAALSRQQISPYKVAGQLEYRARHGYSVREKLEQEGLAGLLDPDTNTPHLAIDGHIAPVWSALKGLPKCRVTTRGQIMRAVGWSCLSWGT